MLALDMVDRTGTMVFFRSSSHHFFPGSILSPLFSPRFSFLDEAQCVLGVGKHENCAGSCVLFHDGSIGSDQAIVEQ